MICLALLCKKFGPCQLSRLSSSVGRALGLESRVSWVRIPPEVANFSLEKKTSSGDLICFGSLIDHVHMLNTVHVQ